MTSDYGIVAQSVLKPEYSSAGTSCRAQTAATVLLFSCQDASEARSAYATATPRFHYYREIMNIFCLRIGPFGNICVTDINNTYKQFHKFYEPQTQFTTDLGIRIIDPVNDCIVRL